MNIMSNLANKAKVGTMALATIGVVVAGISIKKGTQASQTKETIQAELVEKMLNEITNRRTEEDSLRKIKYRETMQKLGESLNRYSKGIDEDCAKLSEALKAYNMPIDSVKHLK